jgi:hypothetical protein
MVRLHQPVEVHHSAKRADVNEPMKRLPAFPPEAAYPTFRGRQRKRNQKNESQKAHGDEGAFRNIFPDACQIEGLIRSDVREEVKTNVSESEEAEHAAKPNQIGEVKKLTEGRDRERDEQESQRPIAGEMLDEFDRVCGELALIRTPTEKTERGEAGEKDNGLGPLAGKQLAHVSNIS